MFLFELFGLWVASKASYRALSRPFIGLSGLDLAIRTLFSLAYGKTRNAGVGCGRARELTALSAPIFNEALKMGPTEMIPPNLWAAIAANPIEAIHPQELQSGLPPN
jgi:hypothetical protein